MAKRAKNTPAVDLDTLVKVFVTLAQFETSETDPVTVQEIAGELDAPLSENAFSLLEDLADAELIEFERGKVWISRENVTEHNAEDIAVNALNGFEPKSDARKRLEYATKVSESQDAVMSQSPEHTGKVVPAVEPVKAQDGSTVTIPVDFEDPSKGRRELDAAKGERLISEDVIKVRETPKPARLPEIDGLDQFIDAETGDMVYESRIIKMGLALDEPESIPERPAGVHAHVWDMAHTAITQSARDYWLARAKDQQEEHTANNGQPAPF